MDDIIQEFLAETNDSLAEMDNDLVLLEQNPHNAELISKIFRILHTIKGTSGFLGLVRLGTVAHKSEDVLGLFRDKKLEVTPAYVTVILEAFDRIKTIITGLEATGEEPQGDDSSLLNTLEEIYTRTVENKKEEKISLEDSLSYTEQPKIDNDLLPVNDISIKGTMEEAKSELKTEASSLRVNVDVLENLMTMVGELVLTRNQLLQISRQNKEGDFLAPLQRLNHVVSDLQEEVMKTRMQPVGNAWAKLPRIIRDISKDLGKKIDLEMHGQETELDRQILDMIKDPLTHMVRNSADHGIETPAERLAKGKQESGKITLSAHHQGGHINIVISDDGKGLPLDKIKKKILENRLASEEQLANMTVQQIQQYIFHAGFSTAEKVTSVSGRGVGMDVVRSNIEKIGGSIEMRSEEGKGTTFTIKIPLTLAIVSALVVGVEGQRFAIPQLAVSELVLINGHNQIENVNDAKVLRLRETLLPLVCLSDFFGLEKTNENNAQYVVVTKVGATLFGLIVDHVYDLEEIVIKPLSENVKKLPVFAGNTILGDGCVIMILDPAGILKTVGVKEVVENKTSNTDAHGSGQRENLILMFRAGNQTLKGVLLETISRLEEIDASDIEYADGKPVIQYLDKLMPINHLAHSKEPDGKCPLIIVQHQGKSTGLIADQILDIGKYYGDIRSEGEKETLDSVIINGHATDIINVQLLASSGIAIQESFNE